MNAEGALPTCYRHPDRETRLACSNCGRPVCVDCVRTAAVGQKCLECAAPAPGSRVLDMDDVRRGGAGAAVVSMTMLALSVAVFALQFLVPPVGDALARFGVQFNPLVADGQWWRVLTAAFFHGGVTHLLFNMWALYVFGPQLEREVGSLPFLGLYVASAALGGATFYFLEPSGIAVGASGAIFGLFGAWLFAAYRGRHTASGSANLRQLLLLLGINLVLGFLPGTRIAWQAHLGGLVAGTLIAAAWTLPALRRQATLRVAAGAALTAVAVGAVLVV